MLLMSFKSYADCAVNNGNINLGTHSSFTINSATSISAQGTGGLNCSGIAVNLLTTNQLSVTIGTTTNNMQLKNSGNNDTIPYLIYPDQNYQHPYTTGQTINYNQLNLLDLIFTSSNISVPLYVRTQANQNVSAGTYTDIINLRWTYRVCYLGAVVCFGSWTGSNVPNSVTVTAIISKDCALTQPPNVNFNSVALVGQFNPVTQSITLRCSKGSLVQTYFSAGSNPTTNWKQMASGNNFLQYQIYRDDGSTLWDTNNRKTDITTGNNQSLTYVAKVNANQAAKPAGNYQDTVSFTVEY